MTNESNSSLSGFTSGKFIEVSVGIAVTLEHMTIP